MNVQINTYKWYGRVSGCTYVVGDDTLPAHTILRLHNRKNSQVVLVIEGKLQISRQTLLEITVAKTENQVIKVARAERDPLGYLSFFTRQVDQRPFAVRLEHDVFDYENNHNLHDGGYCGWCRSGSYHSDHWFAMSAAARRIYVVAFPFAPEQFMPRQIEAGAGAWENLSRYLGKGLIHNQYRIPSMRGWQNRLWPRTSVRQAPPILKVKAYLKPYQIEWLTDCPFVAIVSWTHFPYNGVDAEYEYLVTAYAGGTDEDERALLEWASQFDEHDGTEVLSLYQTEVSVG